MVINSSKNGVGGLMVGALKLKPNLPCLFLNLQRKDTPTH